MSIEKRDALLVADAREHNASGKDDHNASP